MFNQIGDLQQTGARAFELYAIALNKKSRAAQNVKLVKARIYKAIKAAPASYGLVKATETAISAAITLHHDVIEAENNLQKYTELANIAESRTHRLKFSAEMIALQVQLTINGISPKPKIDDDTTNS